MNNFLLMIQLLPTLIEAVTAIETAFPVSGAGAAKLELLKTALQATWTMSQKFEDVWPQIQAVVGGLVKFYKTFKPVTV